MVGYSGSIGLACQDRLQRRHHFGREASAALASTKGHSVQQTADSGYIIGGATESLDTLGDAWLVKTDARGDYAFGREPTADRWKTTQRRPHLRLMAAYVAVGGTMSFGAGAHDVWLIKTDSRVIPRGPGRLVGRTMNRVNPVQQTSDGGYIIAGVTRSYGAGGDDVYLIKTDTAGDTQWTRTFRRPPGRLGLCARQTRDGGYIVGGWTTSYPDSSVYVWLIKTNCQRRYALDEERLAMYQAGPTAARLSSLTDGGYITAGVVRERLLMTSISSEPTPTGTPSGREASGALTSTRATRFNRPPMAATSLVVSTLLRCWRVGLLSYQD